MADAPNLGIGFYAHLPVSNFFYHSPKNILGIENLGRIFGYIDNYARIFFDSILLQVWNSICVTNIEIGSEINLFLNGKLQQLPKKKEITKSGSGNIQLLGLKLVFVTIGKGSWRPFLGSLSDFNMWNRSLDAAEIEKFSKCEKDITESEEMIIDWSKVELNTSEVVIENSDKNDVCNIKGNKDIFIASEKLKTYDDSITYCTGTVGGSYNNVLT